MKNERTVILTPRGDKYGSSTQGINLHGNGVETIGLYNKTTVDNDIHFNQLEKESKARIKYKKYCSHCGKEVKLEDIVRGYEFARDQYVVMTDDELERIKTKKDKTIHICFR